jgi:hypothetical protein
MTITINGSSTTQYFNGWNSFLNPSSYAVQYSSTTGGTTTTSVIKDSSVATVVTSAATINNTINCNFPIVSITNNTSNICNTSAFTTNATSFNVTSLSTGLGQVVLNTDNGALLSSFNCSVGTNYTYSYLTGYTTGSLANAINTLVLSAVGSNASPAASFMNVYSSGYTLNTNLYTKSIIDLSPFTDNGYGFGCVLISPRHVMGVSHASIAVGASIIFKDKNGTNQTKTITSISYGTAGADITIAYLDSAVTGITPYSVLPNNTTATSKIPLSSQSTGAYGTLPQGIYGFTAKVRYPFGGGDYIRQMQLGVIKNTSGSLSSTDYFGGAGISSQTLNVINQSNDVRYPYTNWFSQIANGDSGSPTFLPTGLTTATGTPLTLYLGSQSTVGTASSVSYYITQINAAMNAIKSGGDTTTYALDVISTSQSSWWNGYTSY